MSEDLNTRGREQRHDREALRTLTERKNFKELCLSCWLLKQKYDLADALEASNDSKRRKAVKTEKRKADDGGGGAVERMWKRKSVEMKGNGRWKVLGRKGNRELLTVAVSAK
jgi:hypothetical protein